MAKKEKDGEKRKRRRAAKTPGDLQQRYQTAWVSIEKHLRRQGAHALGILRTGRRLNWIETSGAYECEGFESFDDWREQKLLFSVEWTRQYQVVGTSFVEEELKGKQLSVQALVVIAKVGRPEFRPFLLQYGQRHEATAIRKAIRKADPYRNQRDWERILRQQLERPPVERGPGRQPTRVPLSVAEHAVRCKRRVTSLLKEVQSLREGLQAGEALPVEERFNISAEVEYTIRELMRFNTMLHDGFPTPSDGVHGNA